MYYLLDIMYKYVYNVYIHTYVYIYIKVSKIETNLTGDFVLHRICERNIENTQNYFFI